MFNLFSYINFDLYKNDIIMLIILPIIGLIIRQVVLMVGQGWVRTFSHTTTLCVLPVITYVISKAISNNLALSLGMVGALSIVRFRNPVKSPFELSIYFLVLSLGITASIGRSLFLLLCTASLVIIFGLYLLDVVMRKMWKKSLFSTSFVEGNEFNILEVTANNDIAMLKKAPELHRYTKEEHRVLYSLIHKDKYQLIKYMEQLESNDNVIKIQMMCQ